MPFFPAPSPAPTDTVPPTAAPSPTPEPTASPTTEPTAVPTPEPTPTPVPTPTATPEPTPTPGIPGLLDGSPAAELFQEGVSDTSESYTDLRRHITVTKHSTKELTGRSLVYFVVDVYVQDTESIRRGMSYADFRNLNKSGIQKLSKQYNAIVAVSGDHCTFKDDAYVVIDGEFVFQSEKLTRDLCVLYRDGVMETYSPPQISVPAMEERGVWQTWNFGPLLISENGEVPQSFNLPDTIDDRNPRAAIGYFEPGHYCFVVADGRQRMYSLGLSLKELSKLMIDLGCVRAYNLDGGISAQLTWHKKRVNRPVQDRSILDIIYIPYPESGA